LEKDTYLGELLLPESLPVLQWAAVEGPIYEDHADEMERGADGWIPHDEEALKGCIGYGSD
jgi:hypothetical protein